MLGKALEMQLKAGHFLYNAVRSLLNVGLCANNLPEIYQIYRKSTKNREYSVAILLFAL